MIERVSEVFIARTVRGTHEIIGILSYSNPMDALNSTAEDTDNDHNVLTNEQFHHLQGSPGYESNCSNPQVGCSTLPHRYIGGRLTSHTKLTVTADKFVFDVTVGNNPPTANQIANITWDAPEPAVVTINGTPIGAKNNAVQITASVPGTYRVQIIDPKYISDMIELTAEAPQP